MRLAEIDLAPLFATEVLTPDLPPEIFVNRETKREAPAPRSSTSMRVIEPDLPALGSTLGKYVLERMLGVGGFGAVYRARHALLGNIVAIKLMRPSVARDRPGLVRILLEEARFAALIDHPNVVRVHDVASSDGHTYIVMEHVDGLDLAVLLSRRGALPPRMVVRMMRHLTGALAAGLRQSLVHRDVKPSNVLLTVAGVTKLADFGLARSLNAEPGPQGVVGTAAYMAPEQARDPARADFRADIYSLGITAIQALTNQLPRRGELPPWPRTTPNKLIDLVTRMTLPDPHERVSSYEEIEVVLRDIR